MDHNLHISLTQHSGQNVKKYGQKHRYRNLLTWWSHFKNR